MKPAAMCFMAVACALSGATAASSDGYFSWTEIEFVSAGEWRVCAAESADGNSLVRLQISHNGHNIDVPESIIHTISQPYLNETALLHRFGGNEVVLEIVSFEERSNGALDRRIWSLEFKDDKFVSATLGPVVERSDGF